MKNKFLFLGFLISLMLAGCNAAINFQGKVAGLSYGKFFYEDGNFISEYKTDMDAVWKACEKAVFDLKATGIQEERKISTGTIEAVIQGEKSVIKVEYLDRNVTAVSIFVGNFGNTVASRLIHEKIISNLSKN